jgi:hypothetical protein
MKAFLDYEQHLQMFFDYGADAHARHLVGEPLKPEGYDAWKIQQDKELPKKEKPQENTKKIAKPLPEVAIKGYEFDAEGVPRYLTADDVYNGNENPAWVKKHEKKEYEDIVRKVYPDEKEGINYDEEGIPMYLTKEAYHFGEVNPAWIAKHELDKPH